MQLIIPKNPSSVEKNWQKELADVVTDPAELLQLLGFDPKQYPEDIAARQLFPLRVPRPFIQRMQKNDWHDPLFMQVMSKAEEQISVAGFSKDPLVEQEAAVPGVLHKYKSRVLLILKGGCAINCRYCFRRHFPYGDNAMNKQGLSQALAYIANDSNINEVILSGGDPLMEKDSRLAWLIDELNQIPNIRRLRIHTRLPVVIPSRITPSFVDVLKRARMQCIMVVHINHANEIDQAVANSMKMLADNGVTLLNQTVLLKDINDNADALIALSEGLFDANVLPYYLHLLDKVEGASHFDVAESDARQLIKHLLLELPGFLVPKLVREIAGEGSKTPIDIDAMGSQ